MDASWEEYQERKPKEPHRRRYEDDEEDPLQGMRADHKALKEKDRG